jgi:hypothetical protein
MNSNIGQIFIKQILKLRFRILEFCLELNHLVHIELYFIKYLMIHRKDSLDIYLTWYYYNRENVDCWGAGTVLYLLLIG